MIGIDPLSSSLFCRQDVMGTAVQGIGDMLVAEGKTEIMISKVDFQFDFEVIEPILEFEVEGKFWVRFRSESSK